MIVDCFQEHERAAAIGSWTAWTGIVNVIGPLTGGVLVQVATSTSSARCCARSASPARCLP